MATINTSTGQIVAPGRNMTDLTGGAPVAPAGGNPYATYVSNMGALLAHITSASAGGNAAMTANNEGIQRGEAALATPGQGNPLNPILNLMPGSMRTGTEATLGQIMQPAMLSNAGQAANAEQNSANLTSEVTAQITAYNATKPNWQLSTVPDEDGNWYYYNTNVAPGQPPQQFEAGKIPPGVGGSPGGSPGSADSTASLSASHNPFGIKMTSTTTDMFSGLGATPGPTATDGGNFWSFPDDTTGEKAARSLLISPLYAADSVDQALRQWSNYTGTGQYPGYNGDILKGTGIDPNATIKSLTANQVDVVLAAMKKAEAVPVAAAPNAADNSTIGKIASQVASGALTYDQGVSQINGAYGSAGGYMIPRLLPAIQGINPNFDPNQSNAQGAAKVSNTKLAGDTSALVEKTNGTLDLLEGAFDDLPDGMKEGSSVLSMISSMGGNVLGVKNEARNKYGSLLQEARAGLQAVLNSAAGLGVVTGGVTANSLLPDNMTKGSLQTQITIAKKLMDNTKTALANLANAKVGIGGPTVPADNNPLAI